MPTKPVELTLPRADSPEEEGPCLGNCPGCKCPRVRRDASAPPPAAPLHIGIVGSGNSACALACYLAGQGHEVSLLTRDPEKASDLRTCGKIRAIGKLEGEFPLRDATTDPRQLAASCSTIFLATVANAYPEVARALAPHLTESHELILFSGKLAGCVEVEHVLAQEGAPPIPILETDALFACRLQDDASIWVRGSKNWNLFTGTRASRTRAATTRMTSLFPCLHPATNVIQRGLTDFGAICHPVVMLANLNTIDREDPFPFYYEGLTPRTARILDQMEHEFREVASAYETSLISTVDLLDRYYGCEKESILTAMCTVPNYRHSVSPSSLDHRYFTEDVPCTLVPLQALARKAGLRTPMVDAVIQVASVVTGLDFARTGRSLERLGWDKWSREDIIRWIHS